MSGWFPSLYELQIGWSRYWSPRKRARLRREYNSYRRFMNSLLLPRSEMRMETFNDVLAHWARAEAAA